MEKTDTIHFPLGKETLYFLASLRQSKRREFDKNNVFISYVYFFVPKRALTCFHVRFKEIVLENLSPLEGQLECESPSAKSSPC